MKFSFGGLAKSILVFIAIGVVLFMIFIFCVFISTLIKTNKYIKDAKADRTSIMSRYDYLERHYDEEGFRKYTDYYKYFYNETSIKEFENYDGFKKVTSQDIEDIKGYFKNFEQWVKYKKYYDEYDFNLSQIKENDYFSIHDKEGKFRTPNSKTIYKKYENYDVYYVDMREKIVYFIHNNT